MKRTAAGVEGWGNAKVRRFDAPGVYTFENEIWTRSKTQLSQVMRLVLPKLASVKEELDDKFDLNKDVVEIADDAEMEAWQRECQKLDDAFFEVGVTVFNRELDEVAYKWKYFKDD